MKLKLWYVGSVSVSGQGREVNGKSTVQYTLQCTLYLQVDQYRAGQEPPGTQKEKVMAAMQLYR